MAKLRPDIIVSRTRDITPQMLQTLGVTALFLDLDGTLVPSHVKDLPLDMLDWAKNIQANGVELFLLSNNKSPARVRHFAEKMGIPYAHLSRKPSTRGYKRAAIRLGIDLHRAAMVGDQIFTDTLGANRAGTRSILVETLDTKRWYHKLRRFAETPFRKEKTR